MYTHALQVKMMSTQIFPLSSNPELTIKLPLVEIIVTRNTFLRTVHIIITSNTRILNHKAHLQKSICFIFTCEKKKPSQPIRMVYYSCFTCGSITNQGQCKGLSIANQNCALFTFQQLFRFGHIFRSPSFKFLMQRWQRLRKALDLCRLVVPSKRLYNTKEGVGRD